jgi:hypothetical protein
MRGIAGRSVEGIVLSGGYGDIDLGDEVIYTGIAVM